MNRKRNHVKPSKNNSAREKVESLLEAGRIIEASFFCEKLLQEFPWDKELNRLAFLLAIRRMDPKVKKYDKNLINSGMRERDRYILHCRYYFAFQNSVNLRNSLNLVLNDRHLDMESLQIVVECLIWLRDLPLIQKFISSQVRGRIKLMPAIEAQFKQLLMTRLVELFSIAREKING